jgi:predicted GNAT superfamily acetyltransferase
MFTNDKIDIRLLERPDAIQVAIDVFTEVWGEKIPHVPEIRATVASGGYCAAAFAGSEPVGAVWSFVGFDRDGPYHHSHMAAVRPAFQGRGIGETLKREQARWCLANGFPRIRWTFDPLMGGNARFNLNRLGAVADAYYRDFYGPLGGNLDPGSRFGEPAPSDRLRVTWHLGETPHVEGRVERVPIPTSRAAGDSTGVLEAIAFLRTRLEPLIEAGGIATAVDSDGGEPSYRVVVP